MRPRPQARPMSSWASCPPYKGFVTLLYRACRCGQASIAATFVAGYERSGSDERFLMSDMRIAIAGLGSIGRTLARRLADGVPGLTLACVAARDEEKARGWLDEEGIEVPIVA